MSKTVITSCVRNIRTVPILMQYTDQLHDLGLLSSLRLVDCTNNKDDSSSLRKLCFFGGDLGSVMLDLDYSKILEKDPMSIIAAGVSGYRHRTTSINLGPGSSPISFFIKGLGGSIGINKWEVVVRSEKCFARAGRGGGNIISELCTEPAVAAVDSSALWKFVSISWDGVKINVEFAGCESLNFDTPSDWSSIDVTFSALGSEPVDFIITRSSIFDLKVSNPDVRSYASYHATYPNNDSNDIEIFSKDDIIFLDVEGFKDLTQGFGRIVSIGDDSYRGILRRMELGLNALNKKDMHHQFLDRASRWISRAKKLREKKIPFSVEEGLNVNSGIIGNNSSGLPVLISVIDESISKNDDVIGRYESLKDSIKSIDYTPEDHELNIISYVDSVVGGNDEKVKEFLKEMVGILKKENKDFLLSLLNRSI